MKNDIDLALALAVLRKGVLVALRRSTFRIVRQGDPVGARRRLGRQTTSPATS